jgi:hypothetical protein
VKPVFFWFHRSVFCPWMGDAVAGIYGQSARLSGYNAEAFHHVIPEPPNVQRMDDIAAVRYLRRWGVQVDVKDKTAPQLQSEVYLARLELEGSQVASKSTPNLAELQEQVDILNGRGWWGKRLVKKRMLRWQLASTYGLAWPGYKKAQEDAQAKIQEFQKFQKRINAAIGK